jgi:hypothetical protein
LNRFRIPERVAPSPAAEEPGQQNAAARLRSSREAQSRILAERRGDAAETEDKVRGSDLSPTSRPVAAVENTVKREKAADAVRATSRPAGTEARRAKIKLVILYRLPLALEADLAAIAARDVVTVEYVLRALAREGREELRALTGDNDVALVTSEARAISTHTDGVKVVGDPMTVYLRPDALNAMHRASGDPWCVLPRATVVSAYFTAIVVRLIKARLVQ